MQHKRKIVYIFFCCIKEGCTLQVSFYLTLPVFMGPGFVPKPMSKVMEHVTVSNQNEPRGHEHWISLPRVQRLTNVAMNKLEGIICSVNIHS